MDVFDALFEFSDGIFAGEPIVERRFGGIAEDDDITIERFTGSEGCRNADHGVIGIRRVSREERSRRFDGLSGVSDREIGIEVCTYPHF